jgi:hypothetical protein
MPKKIIGYCDYEGLICRTVTERDEHGKLQKMAAKAFILCEGYVPVSATGVLLRGLPISRREFYRSKARLVALAANFVPDDEED